MSISVGSNKMGRMTLPARIENLKDRIRIKAGDIGQDKLRSVSVDDAVIDTGCIGLALPKRLVEQLGLEQVRTRRMRTTNGERLASIFEAVTLIVQGRDCLVEVFEVPDDCPALIG